MYKMKNKILAFIGSLAIVLVFVLSPVPASAQTYVDPCSGNSGSTSGTRGIVDVVCTVKSIVNIAIPILMAGAFLFFIVQVIKFITSKDAEKRDDARSGMLQGIIGFACILGLWGLVSILLNSVGGSGSYDASQLPVF